MAGRLIRDVHIALSTEEIEILRAIAGSDHRSIREIVRMVLRDYMLRWQHERVLVLNQGVVTLKVGP